MPRPDFRALSYALIRSGISPSHVHRTVTELADHLDDLIDAAIDDGRSHAEAEKIAARQIGDVENILAAMKDQPQLKSWAWRFPHLALFVYPLACIVVLPAMPVIAGVHHASMLARWTACLVLSAVVTATMFLILVLTITFG